MADDVEVKFGGDASGVKKASQDAATSVKSSVASIKETFAGLASSIKESTEASTKATEGLSSSVGGIVKGLETAFSGILEPIKLVAAALAGGALFKEAISSTIEEAAEVKKLANAFGLTTDAASNLNIQLELAGISAEDYTGIAMKFDKQLRSNESGLNALGVATRDSSNALLPQEQLLQNAVATMMEYKAGTDRNAAAMAMFGRSAEDAFKLLKLNADIQERANELQAQGIGISAEAIDAVKAYKVEHAAAGIVLDEFANKIGEAILPGVTSLQTAFVDVGTAVMPIFTAAVEILGAAFDVLGAVIMAVAEIIHTAFTAIGDIIQSIFGDVAPNNIGVMRSVLASLITPIYILKAAFLELADFVGYAVETVSQSVVTFATVAKKALMFDFAGAKAAFDAGATQMEAIAQKHAKKMIDIASDAAEKIKGLWGAGNESSSNAPAKGTKEYQGQDKKDTPAPSRVSEWDQQLQDQKVAYQQTHDLREMSKQDEIAYWQNILAINNMSSGETVAIRRKMAAAQLDEMKKTRTEEKGLAEESINETQKVGEAQIATTTETLRVKKELGLISAQEELLGQRDLENQKYQIQVKALQDKAALYTQDKVARQKALDELQLLEMSHSKNLQKIDNDIVIDQQKTMQKWVDPIKSAFTTSINGIIQGTQTLQQATSKIFQSILLSFVDNLVQKMVDKWLMGEIMKRVFSEETLVSLGIQQKAAAAEQVATQQAAGISGVMSNAAIAAVAAMASVAAIPIIGWAMAPEVGASTYAMGMSFLPSAAGGYDIPAGVNPLVQTHEKEMILPAKHADVIRSMADQGGGSGGGGTHHYHINALDARSVRDYFKANSSSLAPGLKQLSRNFTPVKG